MWLILIIYSTSILTSIWSFMLSSDITNCSRLHVYKRKRIFHLFKRHSDCLKIDIPRPRVTICFFFGVLFYGLFRPLACPPTHTSFNLHSNGQTIWKYTKILCVLYIFFELYVMNNENYFSQGCYQRLQEWLQEHQVVLIVSASAFGCLQVYHLFNSITVFQT